MTIQELRKQIGNEMGLGGWFSPFEGTISDYADLSAADQLELVNRMKAYIRGHPSEFNPTQVGVASTPDLATPSPYTVADAFGDFVGEVGNQAADINDAVNPFSASNRRWILGAVVVVAALYFAGPPLIAALRAPLKTAAK